MINSFREWVLDTFGLNDPRPLELPEFVGFTGGTARKAKKPLPPKTLSKLKKESKKDTVEKNKVSKKKLKARKVDPVDEEYEIDNIFMKLDPHVPEAKKYRLNTVYTEEQKLLYHFRYINYSEESFDLLQHALRNGLEVPDKFVRFQDQLSLKKGRLYFKELPILRPSEIQTLCREMYFDPEKPISPDQIYREISNQAANLSRSKVRKAIQSIEEYQRRRAIRRPKKTEANFKVFFSNTAVCDMFFINKLAFFNVAEAFSGYIKTYYVNSSHAELIKKCMIDFMKEIANYGHTITRVLCDPGSENKKMKTIPNLEVIHTKTAQPMHLAEFYNSLVARRINLYLDLKFDPSEVLDLIMNSLNNRKRQRRSHFTPIEILQMSKQDQKRIAQDIVYRTPDEHYNMKKIYRGSFVRILMLSRKDQRVRPMSYKGYKIKYSKEVYQVSRVKRVAGTINVFKYVINGKEYFRNELLLVPEFVDTVIPEIKTQPLAEPLFDDDDSSGIYVPSELDEDDDA